MKIDLQNAEIIGEGNFAKIYKFFSKEHKNYLCARSVMINPDEMIELEKEKEINRELMNISSPYVLKIFGIEQTEDKILYITQYCDGGSLFECLDMIPNNKLDPQSAIAFSIKIAKGIQVLHNNKITHRDLKPDNILLVRKYKPGFQVPQIKVADFGLSTNNIIMKTLAGTKQYIAPEQAKYHSYTNAVDVWALGIILDEMLHGTPYFVGQNNQQVFKKVTMSEYCVRDKGIPKQIQQILKYMLKRKPFQRPTIGEVIHKLENILDLLKTSKISTITIKNIKQKEKSFEYLCQDHGLKIQYVSEKEGYCKECIDKIIVPVEIFVQFIPDDKEKLFKISEIPHINLSWNIQSDELFPTFSDLFKELKPLFTSINSSTYEESLSKQLLKTKQQRQQVNIQLNNKFQQLLSSTKKQFYLQIDKQIEELFDKCVN